MSRMRLKVYRWYGAIDGYVWDLIQIRPCNGVTINGREGFKTTKAARIDAVSWAAQHSIKIVKKEDIIE